MDLRQLRYFVAIAEHGNFHRASESLNVAQSALSRHMRALGEELGSPLFERTSNGTQTTILGKVFYPEAKAILEKADNAVQRSRKVVAGEIGRLVIGVNELGARHPVFINSIVMSRRRYPEVELVVERMNSPEQVESLLAGKLDCGVLIERPPSPEFEWLRLLSVPFVVGMSQSHPLAAKKELLPEDLAHEKFVALRATRYGPAQAQIFAACRQLGFLPNVIQEAANEQMQLALIRAGLGIAMVPDTPAEIRSSDIIHKPLRGFTLRLDLDLLWRKSNPAKSLSHLIEIFKRVSHKALD